MQFEQRYSTYTDSEGCEEECVDHLAFCLRHRDVSEHCVQANSRTGIRKKKPKPSNRLAFHCPICRRQAHARLSHPLLGLPRDYALSRQSNRLREESKAGEELESEDEQPTPAKKKKTAQPPLAPPADSIAVQRGRRDKRKQQRHRRSDEDSRGSEEPRQQREADRSNELSEDDMPLDDVDDCALVLQARRLASAHTSPHSSSASPSAPSASNSFPLPAKFASRPFRSPFHLATLPFDDSCVHARVKHSTFIRQWMMLERYRSIYEDCGLSEQLVEQAAGVECEESLDEWLASLTTTDMWCIFDVHGWTQHQTKASVHKQRLELRLWIRHSLLRAPVELVHDFTLVARMLEQQQDGDGSEEKQPTERVDEMDVSDDSAADENGDAPPVSHSSSPPSLLASQAPAQSGSTSQQQLGSTQHRKQSRSTLAATQVSATLPTRQQHFSPPSAAAARISPNAADRARTSPRPALTPVPTKLPRVADSHSPRHVRHCERLLADPSLCAALQAMQNKGEWDSNRIARQYSQSEITSLLLLNGYLSEVDGQAAPPKLLVTSLIRLILGGLVQTADEIRAGHQSVASSGRKAHRASGESKEAHRGEALLDSDTASSEHSDSSTAERVRRKGKKSQAEDTLQRRRQEKKHKRQRAHRHESADEAERGESTPVNEIEQEEEETSPNTQSGQQHTEEKKMQADAAVGGGHEVRGDVGVSPPVLPRMDSAAAADDGGGSVCADPPANIRRERTVLSPTSAGSSKSNFPSSQSTFPSSQSSGAVTVQRAISFSSAEQSAASSPSASFSASQSSTSSSSSSTSSPSASSARGMSASTRALLSAFRSGESRVQRYAIRAASGDAEAAEFAREELRLIRILVDGLSEEFAKPVSPPVAAQGA